MSEFKFRVGTSDDKQIVKDFLKRNFYTEEPIFEVAGGDIPEEITDHYLGSLDQGTCTIAEDNEGKIAGLRLAYPKLIDSEKNIFEDPKTSIEMMLRIMQDLADGSNIFEKYNVDKCLQSIAVSVDDKYKRRGLGKRLYEENMKLAKSLGYQVYVCACTSAFSAKACARLGMQKVYEIVYSEYKNPSGDCIISPLPNAPHDRAVIFAKTL